MSLAFEEKTAEAFFAASLLMDRGFAGATKDPSDCRRGITTETTAGCDEGLIIESAANSVIGGVTAFANEDAHRNAARRKRFLDHLAEESQYEAARSPAPYNRPATAAAADQQPPLSPARRHGNSGLNYIHEEEPHRQKRVRYSSVYEQEQQQHRQSAQQDIPPFSDDSSAFSSAETDLGPSRPHTCAGGSTALPSSCASSSQSDVARLNKVLARVIIRQAETIDKMRAVINQQTLSLEQLNASNQSNLEHARRLEEDNRRLKQSNNLMESYILAQQAKKDDDDNTKDHSHHDDDSFGGDGGNNSNNQFGHSYADWGTVH